jgi:uncharacterized membrane protein YkvI
VLILAVFGAAAGAIGNAMFGWPLLAGTLCLMAAIGVFTAFGNRSVESLFKWVSFFLYGVYAVFVVLALSSFGDRVVQNFAAATVGEGWALGGLTYAGYNIVGAVVILPIARHFTRPPRCLGSRTGGRSVGDAAGLAVLRVHGRLASADRSRGAAFRLHAAAAGPAAVSTCCSRP